jgi:hypothetical protein
VNLRDRFSKNTQISNFITIRQVGAELFHSDGQTDMAKLIAPFRDFEKAPKQVRACKITDKLHREVCNL